MLTLLGDFIGKIPPLAKELIMLAIGFLLIMSAWRGGPMRDRFFGAAL